MKPILAISVLLLFAGCSKKFLDTKPLSQIQASDTWKDGGLAEAFVTDIYNGLGNGGFDEQQLSSLSDEAVFVHPGRGINTVNEGTLGPTNPGWVSNTYEWGAMYSRIRATNVALENLKIATFTDTVLNNRLKGEAHFLRAYYYHQLVRYYGAVPLVTKTYDLNQDYSLARSTWSDCVNLIVADCDTAVSLLTGKTLAKGRSTAVSALALKSRILLYAASDLHDVPTAKANSQIISTYSNPELLGYTTGDRKARWQTAKDAAWAAMQAAGGGYKMDLTAPVTAADGQNNYVSIAMGGGSNAPGLDKAASKELLFERDFSSQLVSGGPGTDGTSVGLDNGPNGYHNWAGNAPIQELVDDYEMMDGTKFSWNNSAQASAPYKNRDPRLSATILFDGANWKPRDKITSNPDPANQIQSGSYQMSGGTLQAGLDTRQSPVENWNGSWTGYYMRKFIDPDPAVVDNNTRQYIPWPVLRYTEMVLNYVEANIELGNEPEALIWLNKIRFRAGMPATTASGTTLRDQYRNERRVELAYEEHRYHDARRWMIAGATLGRKIQFINVIGNLKPGALAPAPYHHDETLYNYSYSPVIDNSLENRTWLDKMYFRPITRDEVNKNNKLIQNPGYSN
ncbi:MAG: RagB/SusD family nutrient uptake outer membrane protein [Bacteroidetes bacterium]|nr:RagB/SusD family nutrient uptake outer membrane protein [Bacteroidota bacterium]